MPDPSRGLVLVVPGRLETRTGGYTYDRRMVEELRRFGWSVEVCELPDEFPSPSPAARAEAARVLRAMSDETLVVVDGLAGGVLAEELEAEAPRLRLVSLVHHPLALETGLDAATAGWLERSERRALAAVRGVVVTSARTAEAVAPWLRPAQPIAVVEPGTDPAALAAGSGGRDVHLLCVATLTPRKGHDLLFRALSRVPSSSWRLTCVGNLDRDPHRTSALRDVLRREGIGSRVDLPGEAHGAALDAVYHTADVFVLATHYEGYGMVVAEALARGLPVVSTRTGGIPDLVGEEAGVLVAPGDEVALADALSRIIVDTQLRARLAAGARRRREALATWQDAGRAMAAALTHMVTHG